MQEELDLIVIILVLGARLDGPVPWIGYLLHFISDDSLQSSHHRRTPLWPPMICDCYIYGLANRVVDHIVINLLDVCLEIVGRNAMMGIPMMPSTRQTQFKLNPVDTQAHR